jgi:hypothetical protein
MVERSKWLGTSSLAIQYWDLYIILNEKKKDSAGAVGWHKSKMHF